MKYVLHFAVGLSQEKFITRRESEKPWTTENFTFSLSNQVCIQYMNVYLVFPSMPSWMHTCFCIHALCNFLSENTLLQSKGVYLKIIHKMWRSECPFRTVTASAVIEDRFLCRHVGSIFIPTSTTTKQWSGNKCSDVSESDQNPNFKLREG